MSQYTLTSIDATGIQNYIFGSNRLAENIGASQLVERALSTWLAQALPEPHNFTKAKIVEQVHIETTPGLRAEVVMCGGGNALLLFREHEDAVATIRRLSRTLLCESPGLELAVAHYPFAWEQDALGGAEGVINRLAAQMNQQKQQRAPRAPILAPSVLAECRATRQPVVTLDRDGKLVAAEVAAKLDDTLKEEAEERFDQIFRSVVGNDYTFVRDVERMLADDERNHLAVVHADGNGMGRRFIRLLEHFPHAQENRECVAALRDLSQRIAQAGEKALGEMLARLERSFQHAQMARYVKGLECDGKQYIMPLRPLVFGGDDMTFICDGKLGLGLAAILLQEFERATTDLPYGGQAYACAGVVIFKSHYPFARAYHLCEELCKQTKVALRLAKMQGSGLDWHIAMSGISGSIGAIRKREYELPNNEQLTIRPLSLHQPWPEEPWRSWQVFSQLAETFGAGKSEQDRRQNADAANPFPRSKLKALREALRSGSGPTKNFLDTADMSLPDVVGDSQQNSGWVGKQCLYFDAIESLDFYLPIDRMEDR